MNKNITLVFAFLLTCFLSFGQRKQGYDNDSRWFWTINAGSTWTTTDVKSKNDWGWGLTLGKSFNYNYGRAVSFDFRGRFLTGYWYGQDKDTTGFSRPNQTLSGGNTNYKDSLGFSVLNHRTRAAEVDLELVMHMNKLRERTGWDLYVFGGIGVTGFRARGDLLDVNGNMYAYDALPDYTQSTLNSTLDETYESTLDDNTLVNFALTPSLGFGLGYQLAPRFSVGLEHKTTFTRLDYFDGYNNPAGKYENDWFHYTSAYARFHIRKQTPTVTDHVDPISQAPEVIFTNPNVSGTVVSSPNYTIQALVKFVNGKDNINFRQNGNYVGNFSYNASTDKFESNVVLQPGQNVFEIIASNVYGTDQESTIIIYRQAQEAAPVVTFTNPNTNPHTTSIQNFNVLASILNIQNGSQVAVSVNGQSVSNFTYKPATSGFEMPIVLLVGSNVVTITATNSVGSDTESTTIIYNPAQNTQLPVVYFTDPSVSPLTVKTSSYNIKAEVMYVAGSENITFKQNGSVNQNFTYNANSDDFMSTVVLTPGQNVFEIIASNNAGVAQATTIIIYDYVAPKPPVVTITNPGTTPYTTENAVFPLNATILNITQQSQAKVSLNGQYLTNFVYMASTSTLTANLNLVEGTNTVVVTGTNNDGTDSKQTIIIYKKPVVALPPVVTFTMPSSSPTTVSNPSYAVTASVLNVDNTSGINVNVNGINFTGFNFNSATKTVSFNLNLIEGVNVVVITGTNAVGVDSKTTTIIYQKPQTVIPPVVTFIDPIVNPLTVFTPSYMLKVRVQNVASYQNITLKINGVNSSAFTYNASTQMMEFNSALLVGANIFEVTGTNSAGQDSKSTTIVYKQSEPLLKPVVTITNPFANPYTTGNPSAWIEATVLNVENAQNIQVMVNGMPFTGFSYNSTTKQVTFNMSLIEGTNTLSIKGTNAAGEASDARTIIYKKEVVVNPPVVTFINPATSGTTVNSPTFTIKANVLNIDQSSQIVLTQNGQVINHNLYSFNANTKELVFNTGLSLGNNIFTIQATNTAGTHSATTSIIYQLPIQACDKPVVTILSPATSGTEVSQANNTVKFKVLNVTGGNQIKVFVNGALQNPGVYNTNTKIYDLNVNYTIGQNIVEVVATNSCGEVKANTLVVYKIAAAPCEAPILQLIQPINMESTVDIASIEVRVAILNIANQNDIVFKLNGVTHAFTYNTGNHILIANINLIEGLNTIQVQASNDCGSGGFPIKITRKVCQKPVINITNTSIANNGVTYAETFTMEGNVQNITEQSQLVITRNGLPISFVFNPSTKTFSFTSNIEMKFNTFELKAQNSCGDDVKTHKVNRLLDPNAVPPVIKITNPSTTPFNTTTGAFNVQGTIQHVTAANQVSLTVNGSPVNANINIGNGSLTYNMTLVEGANVIVATAVNQYGSSTDTKTIIFTKPVVVEKPVIVLTDPGACPAVLPEGTNLIKGYILNITDLNQVSIKINGNSVSNYNPILVNGKLNFQFTVNIDANNNNLNLSVWAQNQGGSDAKSCVLKMVDKPVENDCKPQITVKFSADNKRVTITSTQALSNVVLKFIDGTVQKFDNLSGMTISSAGTGANMGKCIVGAWIKSGCNSSNDGPNYGEWFANTQNMSNCTNTTTTGDDCKPTVSAVFSADNKSVSVTSTKDLSNVVLKYYDGQEQKFDGLSGKTGTFSGTGANAGKCIVGVWIKSGCNTSNDGPNYGEYVKNNGYNNQCATNTESCGPRFNPGNGSGEFCLVTPNGTFTRDNLVNNPNFTYSGSATAVYFKPIAGGGNVTVNGSPLALNNGDYYLFSGNLTVEIKNPNGGGNGHWVICLQSNTMPTFGNGANKPKSPCDITPGGKKPGEINPSNNGGGTTPPVKTPKTIPAGTRGGQ